MKLSSGSYKLVFVFVGIFLGAGFVETGMARQMVDVFTNQHEVSLISSWMILAFGIILGLLSFRIPSR